MSCCAAPRLLAASVLLALALPAQSQGSLPNCMTRCIRQACALPRLDTLESAIGWSVALQTHLGVVLACLCTATHKGL